MGHVPGANFLRLVVVLRVVVAVGQAETARAGEGDNLGGVRVVLIRIEAEEEAARAGREMQSGEHRGKMALRVHPEYPVEIKLQWPPARFLGRGFVHAGGEIVPDFLLRKASAGSDLRQAVENSPEETLIIVGELAVHAPARLVGRNGVVPDPSPAGELVEVDAGIRRLVHCARVEAGCVGERGQRHLGRPRRRPGRGSLCRSGKAETRGQSRGGEEKAGVFHGSGKACGAVAREHYRMTCVPAPPHQPLVPSRPRLAGFALRAVIGFFPLIPGAALAAEGMWLLDNLPLSRLQEEYKFTPSRDWVDRVMRASARIAGGCSASFVSKDGLVMTNHHCAARCFSQLSTAEKNLAAAGFLAHGRQEEARCPEIELNRLERITDVTGEVKGATAGLDGEAFKDAQNAIKAKLSSACVGAERQTTRCDVVDLYHGGRYHLYKYHRFQDVRLVWAPEQAIAFFGGDPDNFNFPRYDLDVALLRAYENGRPAQTKDFFPFSKAGAEAGET